MPLPDDVTTFTLTFGHPDNGYTDATGAVALVGMKAKLVPVDLLTGERTIVTHVETGQVIVAVDVTMTIDADGKGSVGPLPHTDNPTLSPIGFGYSVEFADVTGPRRMAPDDLVIAVPAAAGSTVDFDLLGEAEAVPGVFVPIGIGPAGPVGPTGPTGATGPAGTSADPAALTALSNRITANETDLAAATDAGTASTLVRRNSAGYFSANGVSNMAAPGNAGDAVNKAYADALGTQFATPSSIMRRDAFGNIYANQFYVSGTQDTDPAALTRRDYVDNTAGTSVNTASALVRRDANSRFQAANPSANQDVATKNYADTAAGAISATANTVMRRDVSADTSVNNIILTGAAPAFASHATRKDYVDNTAGSTTAIGNTLARRTAGGSSTFATAFIDNVPSAASHATRKDYVDAQVAGVTSPLMQIKPPVGGAITQGNVTSTTPTPAIGDLWLSPFIIPGSTYDLVSCRVQTPNAAATVKIVAYTISTATGLPGTLIFETAAVAATAGGFLGVTLPSALVVPSAGLAVWWGLVNQGTVAASFWATNVNISLPRLDGDGNTIDLGNTAVPASLKVTGVTGSAPTLNPTVTWNGLSGVAYKLALRRSA